MTNLYMRKTQFTCGGLVMGDPLTIKFKIPFDDSEKVNNAEIRVYNLKPSTISSIALKKPAILNAGYVDDSGVIFSGLLKLKSTEWQDLDKVTTFFCVDSPAPYLENTFKKSYARNTKASTILKEVAAFAGLGIGDIDLPIDFAYRTGKTVYGKPKNILTEIAKDCKAKIYTNKDKLYVRGKNKGNTITIPVSKDTGLLDEPEAFSDEIEVNGKKVKRNGYKLKMLLNHRITTDVVISLKSKKVNGTFRVEKGEHSADDNAFFTECEVFPT